MHDTWNPWHGCKKISEGCTNCYMYFLDQMRAQDGSLVRLPSDWGDGWENIMINVTAENQKRADERIPILLDLPFKHKGIMCAPLLSEIHIEQYLSDKIEQIIVGGENYNGSRPCHYE